MNTSPTDVLMICAFLAATGVGFVVLAWLVRVTLGAARISPQESLRQTFAVKLSFFLIAVGALLMALAIFGGGVAICWWVIAPALENLSPRKLALLSLVVGPAPLLVSLVGMLVMKLLGGHADGDGVHVKPVCGIDLSGVLTACFMMHWLVIFTGGLAVLGLFCSAIWWLINTSA